MEWISWELIAALVAIAYAGHMDLRVRRLELDNSKQANQIEWLKEQVAIKLQDLRHEVRVHGERIFDLERPDLIDRHGRIQSPSVVNHRPPASQDEQ